MQDFFQWIGEQVGAGIRVLVDGLGLIFDELFAAMDSFLTGVTQALGINTSAFSIAFLVLGLFCLYAAVRAFMRRGLIRGVLWLAMGLLILGWLIN